MDKVKLVLSALLVAGGVVGFYELNAEPLLVRVGVLLVALVVAAALTLWTALGQSVWAFIKEARLELRKVVWPTRKETVQSTAVVIVLVLAIALFLWVVDFGLVRVVKVITGERF